MTENFYDKLAKELGTALAAMHQAKLEMERLEAENGRLRDALERISKASMPHEEPVSRMIARAALDGKE